MSEKTAKFYCIEVHYKKGPEYCFFRLVNMDPATLMAFRRDVFTVGARRFHEPGTEEIIPPHAITSIMVYHQVYKFRPDEEDKPLERVVIKPRK